MTEITLAIDAGIATLTLNRPQVMNALAISTIRAMRAALAELRAAGDVRVLIITGVGRGFCTGADLSDPVMSLDGPLEARAGKLAALMREDINALMAELHALPIPKLAAVNGAAVGAGVGVALAADIVLAAESAYFMQVFAPRLGLVPDMGATWHMPRLIGRARALATGLLGERIDAKRAAEWGMIWRVVPDAALMEETLAIAHKLAAGPTAAFAELPKLLDAGLENDYDAQLAAEAAAQCRLVATHDAQEAVQAFRAKRPPAFRGI